MRLVAILQSACALQNKINLFFTFEQNILTLALRINRNFRKARYTSQDSTVRVTCPEDWLVVAGSRGQISLRFAQVWQIPMQPRGVDVPILGREIRDQQQEQQDPAVHSPGKCAHNSCPVVNAGIPQNVLDANRNLSFY